MKKIISLFAIGAFMLGGITPAFASPSINYLTLAGGGFQDGRYNYDSVDSSALGIDIYKKSDANYYIKQYTVGGDVDISDVLALHQGEPWYKSTTGLGGIYYDKNSGYLTPVGNIVTISYNLAPVSSSVFKDVNVGGLATNTASALSGTAGNLMPVVGLAVALPLVFWVIMRMQETVDPEKIFVKKGKKKHGR